MLYFIIMKRFILMLTMVLIASCAPTPTDQPDATFKAIYLVQERGQLSGEDLQSYSEVRVTGSFDEFTQLGRQKAALWIDINATELVNKDWLDRAPQKFYPLVLIGIGDALCAFRDTLGGFGIIEGPYVDCSSPPPGFSLWMLEEDTGSGSMAFMQGYEQIPTVKGILEKTNLLLEGKNPLLERN